MTTQGLTTTVVESPSKAVDNHASWTSFMRPVSALAAHFCRLYSYVGTVAHRVYKAASSDPDTLTFDEALKDSTNLSDWIAAANKETDPFNQLLANALIEELEATVCGEAHETRLAATKPRCTSYLAPGSSVARDVLTEV